MFVHAHPDDESSKGAATMAKYAKEGHRVSVVTLTDGGAGDILNPAMDRPGVAQRITEIREQELARALEIIGVTDHFFFGYPDSGYHEDFDGDGSVLADDAFFNVDIDEVVGRLVELIRRVRPDVLLTYPEGGGYPHPDHIRCHDVSAAAYAAAADPEQFPGAGAPHEVSKLYYMGVFTKRKLEALHQACLDRGMESPFTEWLQRWDSDYTDPTTTRIDVGDHLSTARQALLAHATQIDPDGRWFTLPDDVIREVYPWEEFELAETRVDTSLPEDSLFAGVAGHYGSGGARSDSEGNPSSPEARTP
ncbi:MAG: mycothiol conjugate amidase Mca [Actinobacteria bacterium]|nr:mycothiol conjugate amidase Mca [Actinomycetota bacterium]